jgi:hypothetical protein
MLRREDAGPVKLLIGRPAEPKESPDQLVLTAERRRSGLVVVVDGPKAQPCLLLLDVDA